MAFSELELKLIEQTVGEFCRKPTTTLAGSDSRLLTTRQIWRSGDTPKRDTRLQQSEAMSSSHTH